MHFSLCQAEDGTIFLQDFEGIAPMCIFWVLGALVRTPKPFRYWIPRCTWIFSLEAGGMVSVLLSHDGPRRGSLVIHFAGHSPGRFHLNIHALQDPKFKNNFIRDFLSALSFSLSGYLITFRYRTTVLILFFPFYFWAIICLVLTSHPFIELFIFNFYDSPFLFHLISMFLLYWIWETRNLIAS